MIKKSNLLTKVALSIFLVIFYFFCRIQNLTAIPVFCDEAIYIRWAQIIQSVETLRFVPLTDGKQPLFMWINSITFRFFSDPLVAGRIISVFSGFGIALIISLTTIVIVNFDRKTKNLTLFLKEIIKKDYYLFLFVFLVYCLIPFAFFFDRLALADNLLSFFGSLTLLLSLLLSKFPNLGLSILLGFSLGLAWLTKSPAIYFIVLSFLTFIFLNLKKIKSWFYPTISTLIGFIIYNILRLGPQFHQIALRNKDYVWTLSEVLKHPLDPLKPHLINAIDLYFRYLSWPILTILLVSTIIFLFKKNISNKQKTIFVIPLCWWVLPLIANSAMAKVFTARYILFTLPPLLIIISIFLWSFLQKINKNIFKIIVFLLIFSQNFIFLYKISLHPFDQKLASSESGYLEGWTSGWGIKESFDYLKEKSLTSNVIIGTEGSFGTLPEGFQIYANKVNQLTVIGQGLGFADIPKNLIEAKEYGDDVYLLINQSRFNTVSLEQGKIKLIKSFDKPDSDKLLLYQLN